MLTLLAASSVASHCPETHLLFTSISCVFRESGFLLCYHPKIRAKTAHDNKAKHWLMELDIQ